jgi:transcriptional regulator with XRE-family HTH domain
MKRLGDFLKAVRLARGLTLPQVARRLGYGNIRKGVNRLRLFEATGAIKEDLLLAVLDVLGVDLAAVEELMDSIALRPAADPIMTAASVKGEYPSPPMDKTA